MPSSKTANVKAYPESMSDLTKRKLKELDSKRTESDDDPPAKKTAPKRSAASLGKENRKSYAQAASSHVDRSNISRRASHTNNSTEDSSAKKTAPKRPAPAASLEKEKQKSYAEVASPHFDRSASRRASHTNNATSFAESPVKKLSWAAAKSPPAKKPRTGNSKSPYGTKGGDRKTAPAFVVPSIDPDTPDIFQGKGTVAKGKITGMLFCNPCEQKRRSIQFSETELRKHQDERRCKFCVADNKPIKQKLQCFDDCMKEMEVGIQVQCPTCDVHVPPQLDAPNLLQNTVVLNKKGTMGTIQDMHFDSPGTYKSNQLCAAVLEAHQNGTNKIFLHGRQMQKNGIRTEHFRAIKVPTSSSDSDLAPRVVMQLCNDGETVHYVYYRFEDLGLEWRPLEGSTHVYVLSFIGDKLPSEKQIEILQTNCAIPSYKPTLPRVSFVCRAKYYRLDLVVERTGHPKHLETGIRAAREHKRGLRWEYQGLDLLEYMSLELESVEPVVRHNKEWTTVELKKKGNKKRSVPFSVKADKPFPSKPGPRTPSKPTREPLRKKKTGAASPVHKPMRPKDLNNGGALKAAEKVANSPEKFKKSAPVTETESSFESQPASSSLGEEGSPVPSPRNNTTGVWGSPRLARGNNHQRKTPEGDSPSSLLSQTDPNNSVVDKKSRKSNSPLALLSQTDPNNSVLDPFFQINESRISFSGSPTSVRVSERHAPPECRLRNSFTPSESGVHNGKSRKPERTNLIDIIGSAVKDHEAKAAKPPSLEPPKDHVAKAAAGEAASTNDPKVSPRQGQAGSTPKRRNASPKLPLPRRSTAEEVDITGNAMNDGVDSTFVEGSSGLAADNAMGTPSPTKKAPVAAPISSPGGFPTADDIIDSTLEGSSGSVADDTMDASDPTKKAPAAGPSSSPVNFPTAPAATSDSQPASSEPVADKDCLLCTECGNQRPRVRFAKRQLKPKRFSTRTCLYCTGGLQETDMALDSTKHQSNHGPGIAAAHPVNQMPGDKEPSIPQQPPTSTSNQRGEEDTHAPKMPTQPTIPPVVPQHDTGSAAASSDTDAGSRLSATELTERQELVSAYLDQLEKLYNARETLKRRIAGLSRWMRSKKTKKQKKQANGKKLERLNQEMTQLEEEISRLEKLTEFTPHPGAKNAPNSISKQNVKTRIIYVNPPIGRDYILMAHEKTVLCHLNGMNCVLMGVNSMIAIKREKGHKLGMFYLKAKEMVVALETSCEHEPQVKRVGLAAEALALKDGGRFKLIPAGGPAFDNNMRHRRQRLRKEGLTKKEIEKEIPEPIDSFYKLISQTLGIFVFAVLMKRIDGSEKEKECTEFVGHCAGFNAGADLIHDGTFNTAFTMGDEHRKLTAEELEEKIFRELGYIKLLSVHKLMVKRSDVEAGEVPHFVGPENPDWRTKNPDWEAEARKQMQVVD